MTSPRQVPLTKFYAKSSPGGLSLFSKDDNRLLEELPVILAKPEHRSYILSTWVKSYESMVRRLLVGGMRFPNEEYRAGESRLAEAHWDKANVLVSPGDEYTIHGWVVGNHSRLYHVYVPPQLRGNGVARALVERVCGVNGVYTYSTHKPWPSVPRGHQVTWSPYI